ncbi:MAG: hypothetical protein P8X82_14605 [Gemmatimonadales bacterium]
MHLPSRRFARAILLRSVVIWIGVRFAASFGSMLVPDVSRSAPPPTPYSISLVSSAVVVLMTATLTRLDCTRRNETLFLSNLGVRSTAVTGIAAIIPLLLGFLEKVLEYI